MISASHKTNQIQISCLSAEEVDVLRDKGYVEITSCLNITRMLKSIRANQYFSCISQSSKQDINIYCDKLECDEVDYIELIGHLYLNITKQDVIRYNIRFVMSDEIAIMYRV